MSSALVLFYENVDHLEKKYCQFILSHVNIFYLIFVVDFLCFNATFSNISAISWRPVLVVEEAGVPGENHRPTGKLYHLRLRVECTLVCNLQSRARNRPVLVIGLYELLDPAT
jgi:hypothetical protein